MKSAGRVTERLVAIGGWIKYRKSHCRQSDGAVVSSVYPRARLIRPAMLLGTVGAMQCGYIHGRSDEANDSRDSAHVFTSMTLQYRRRSIDKHAALRQLGVDPFVLGIQPIGRL